MENKNIRVLLCIVMVLVSSVTAGLLAYSFTDSLIQYELADSSISTSSEEPERAFNNKIEDIPYSDSYTMHMHENRLYVNNAGGETVYMTEIQNRHYFSDKDTQELNGNGIFFPTRSNLIDTLIYLNS